MRALYGSPKENGKGWGTRMHLSKAIDHHNLFNWICPRSLTRDRLELRPQEFEEVVDDLDHLNDVIADLDHVVGAGKQQLLGELPAGITATDLNLLTDLEWLN